MINTSKLQYSIQDLYGMYKAGNLNLSPIYQRGYVTKSIIANSIIESILAGIEIPSLYFANHSTTDKRYYNVLDGKQRLESIFNFIDGQGKNAIIKKDRATKSKVIQAGLCSDISDKRFRDLSSDEQSKILNYVISVNIIQCKEEMEAYMFEILNTGSTKLSKVELLKAKYYKNPIIKKVSILSDEFAEKMGERNENAKQRMLLAFLASMEVIEQCTIQGKFEINFTDDNRPTFGSQMDAIANQFIERCEKEKEKEDNELELTGYYEKWIEKKTNYIKKIVREINICLGNFAIDGNPKSIFANIANEKSKNKISFAIFIAFVSSFSRWIKPGNNNQKIIHPDNYYDIYTTLSEVRLSEEFIECIANTTMSTERILARNAMIVEAIENKFQIKSGNEPRYFTTEQKKQIRYKQTQDGKLYCNICNMVIIEGFQEINYDHIIPWSQGGKTTVDNGQVVHKTCNCYKGDKTI